MQSAGFDAYDIVNGFAGIVAHLPERTLHGKVSSFRRTLRHEMNGII